MNEYIRQLAKEEEVRFIDTSIQFNIYQKEEKEFTIDGIHLNPKSAMILRNILEKEFN